MEATLENLMLPHYAFNTQGPHVRDLKRVRGFTGTGKIFLCPPYLYPRAQIETHTRTRGCKLKPVSSP